MDIILIAVLCLFGFYIAHWFGLIISAANWAVKEAAKRNALTHCATLYSVMNLDRFSLRIPGTSDSDGVHDFLVIAHKDNDGTFEIFRLRCKIPTNFLNKVCKTIIATHLRINCLRMKNYNVETSKTFIVRGIYADNVISIAALLCNENKRAQPTTA